MKIGGWFKDCDKIQKSVRRDPNPRVPFVTSDPFYLGTKELPVIGIVIFVVIFVIATWALV